MTDEEFDVEFPVGSLKRQEELIRLEHASQLEQTAEVAESAGVPESVWRAPSA